MRSVFKLNREGARRVARLLVGVGLSILVCGGASLQAGNGGKGKPCKKTAVLARRAAFAEASADYWLALARASTVPDEEYRDEAKDEAREEFRESIGEAREQYAARIEVCEWLDETWYQPVIDPDDFLTPEETAANPNPFWPLVPGTTYHYQAETTEGTELIDVEVTHETREILGVMCIVVTDIVNVDGELKEYTWDWYAQDRAGNVWYFGELSLTYENGALAGIEGSWEAGVDDAQPGILMEATPEVGDVYRQEYLVGEAEDAATVLSLNEMVMVPYGSYNNCLMTGEFTALDPETLEVMENKFYAAGTGLVLEEDPETGERLELLGIDVE